ncbi:MAG: 16S rRNA (cytosine(967)-C(5))-methyltransferase RsmB [Verrucomicrobiales bacterium]|nr:16S rRNA (cytosine(967)-C(5))-methyltransferase RsmB [Verrucomicrobiales bacterium]
MSARRCALEALNTWEDTSVYADEILSELAGKFRLSSADRGLAQDIFYGTIRNLFLVDEIIEKLRRGRIKPATQNVLRIGLYQIFCSGIANHAAVNETVNLARQHEKGLVNAILRNALRREDEFKSEIETWPLEDRYSHSGFLIERWEKQFGEENTRALLEWNNRPPSVFARINTLASDEALNRVRSETQPCLLGADHPDFFKVEGAPNIDWLNEGLIYIQDPSTSHSCRLLAPQPGEAILDACAAPGGKTGYLAALMGNTGQITATDSSNQRLQQTRENLDRLGVTNTDVSQADWFHEDQLPEESQFDAILLDVPCSNSGVMRRRVDVRWRLQPDDFTRQAEVQARLLKNAARYLKPEGRLVYSTCSIDHEENEGVIEASGLRVEEIQRCLPWENGYDGSFAALLRP